MAAKAPSNGLGHFVTKLKPPLAATPTADTGGEVALILKQMLTDISDRLRILDGLDSSASTHQNDMQAKLIEWQTKLVDLSNAADKAVAASEAQALQRQTLAGEKKQADQTAAEETGAFKLMLPPYIKEIYVIGLIKGKILASCAA
mmetsp:Transcript_75897/g.203323  ORF Transcript_75897/g.203323 Transcript_75897/m.203323 type:complete len:146 (+) Transcript_75897:2-439(+)